MFTQWLRTALVLGILNGAIVAQAAGTEKFFENASSNNALLNLINNSKKTIDIEIYEVKDARVHAAILAAIQRGVKVRIIQEPLTASPTCKIFEGKAADDTADCLARKKFVRDVRAKGGVYVPFNLANLCGQGQALCFQHGKMVISDGQFAFMSTGNFNASNLCDKTVSETCNRDYSVLTWDPGSVKTLQKIFNLDLIGKRYDLKGILAQPEAAKLTVSPYVLEPLVAFIRSAKQMVQVQNQYLNEPTLNAALIEAAQRGVKVYVMVASLCSFHQPKPGSNEVANWTRVFTAFDQAGVKSRIFTRKIKVGGAKGYLHSKAILVDSTRAWVGSVNGSVMSTSRNREFGIFIDDPTEALKLGAFMKSDFREPMSETWRQSIVCAKDELPPLVDPTPGYSKFEDSVGVY